MRSWAEQKARELQSRKAWVTRLAAQGYSINKTADRAGLSRRQLYLMATTFDVKFSNGRAGKAKENALKALIAKGCDQTQIAESLGINRSSVSRAIHRKGLKGLYDSVKKTGPSIDEPGLSLIEKMKRDAKICNRRMRR